MKTVAPHPFVPKAADQGIRLRQLGHVAVKRRVEAGHLRQARIVLLHGPNRLELVRQMLGRQADDLVQADEHLGRDHARLAIFHPAVHHAMADGVRLLVGKTLSQAAEQDFQRRVVVGQFGVFFQQGLTLGIPHAEDAAAESDPLDFARQGAHFALPHLVEGIFQA